MFWWLVELIRSICREKVESDLGREGQIYGLAWKPQGRVEGRADVEQSDGMTTNERKALVRGSWHRRDSRVSSVSTI